MINWHL